MLNWSRIFGAVDTGLVPDTLIRFGIRKLLQGRLEHLRGGGVEGRQERLEQLLRTLRESPIALATKEANEQHYELPPEFFRLVLGKHLKYSCGLWSEGVHDLDGAEESMLRVYEERAQLENGLDILDLGCGWGSLSLWLARRYSKSRVVALSNSKPQKDFIDARAQEEGLGNLRVITEDVNRFDTEERFDRVFSIEMFEHMRNHRALLEKTSSWLRDEGLLLVHIFTHDRYAYPFETGGDDDWMGRHFFTGGLMPSHDLLLRFQDDVFLETDWTISGRHYQKTADAWLANLDRNADRALRVLSPVYGEEAKKWLVRWRVFFMACSELWGFRGGNEWTVSHYRFRPRKARGALHAGLVSKSSAAARVHERVS